MRPTIILQANENILFEGQPQSRLAIYLMFTLVFRWVTFFILFFVLSLYHGTLSIILFYRNYMGIGIFAILLFSYLWGLAATNRHAFVITNQRCILYSGFWGVTKKVLTYRMISDVDLRINPIQALLGISSIYLVTIGMSGFNRSSFGGFGRSNFGGTAILGLTREQAEQLTSIISAQLNIK